MLELKQNEPLAKHSTFGVGGAAAWGAVAHTVAELQEALAFAAEKNLSWRVLGGGSNLLVSDAGFPGVIIWYANRDIEIVGDIVRVGAGAVTASVAGAAARAGLTGFEWGAGVPGTIGGAVHGNAGATGGEMAHAVVSVEVFENGEVKEYSNADCHFGYRNSIFKTKAGAIILSATLQLRHAPEGAPMANMAEVLRYRMKTQPKGAPSSGCTFKNVEIDDATAARLAALNVPENFLAARRVPAGWLIEAAGLKGLAEGGATVSQVHGNFIVTSPAATAADISKLIAACRAGVAEKFGLQLETEITVL